MWSTLFLYLLFTVVTVALAALVAPKPVNAYATKCSGQMNSMEKRVWIKDHAALTAVFFLLSTLLVLRVNIGNDYYRYTQIMHELRYDGYVITEPGFNLVCRFILKTKLWWNAGYLICFAVIGIATIGFLVKAMYDLSEDFKLTFFLFMTLGMYFQTFSTVRYYLALGIILYAIRFLLNRKYAGFIILVLLAASFHKISLIVLPAYFLAIIPWKKWHLGIFAVLSLQFLIFKDFYLKIMLKLYPSYEGESELLLGGTSLANIFRSVAVLVLCVVYYKKCIQNQPKNKFFFFLNLCAVALYTCCYYVPVISRIGYFFNISQLFLLPAFVRAEKNEKRRKLLTGCIVFAGICYFLLFLDKMTDSLAIVPYQTWVFTDMTPINMLDW